MNKKSSRIANKILPSISLVIPIFNNAATAEKILIECYQIIQALKVRFEVIICNDGSTDNTAQIIQRFAKKYKNVQILTYKKNRGIALSLKELYARASENYILLFSVDGGWEPRDVGRLIQSINKKNTDIIIGERRKKQYNAYRQIVSFMYNALPLLFFGTKTYDVGSIKIFKSEIFKRIHLQSKSVFLEAELLIKAKREGYSIAAISVTHKKTPHKLKSGVNFSQIKNAVLDIIKLKITQI